MFKLAFCSSTAFLPSIIHWASNHRLSLVCFPPVGQSDAELADLISERNQLAAQSEQLQQDFESLGKSFGDLYGRFEKQRHACLALQKVSACPGVRSDMLCCLLLQILLIFGLYTVCLCYGTGILALKYSFCCKWPIMELAWRCWSNVSSVFVILLFSGQGIVLLEST